MPETKGKAGGRSKRTEEVERDIYRCLGVGLDYKTAAQFVGVGYSTLRRWRAEDGDFQARCDSAIAGAKVTVASKLLEKANGGNLSAMIFWLKTRTDEFKEIRHLAVEDAPDKARALLAARQEIIDSIPDDDQTTTATSESAVSDN